MANEGAKVLPLHRRQEAVACTDDELMELAAAGAADAYPELVRRYEHAVRVYCAKWCGGAAVGDDVAQEVLLDLWHGRARYRPSGRFRAYLFTLVRNRCRSAARKRRPEVSLHEALPAATADALGTLLMAERQRRVDGEVSRLPPKLREAVLLRFGAGLSYEEMAQVLRRPQATVRSRVFHGIARLREQLGEVPT